MGLAVGADYSIGSPLLSEFTTSVNRGNYLGVLEILWNVGYVVAYLIGYLINQFWAGGWRITLAASAIPAVICLIIRHGLPESPRWLISKGRRDEATEIVRHELHVDADAEDFAEEREEKTEYRVLFSPEYRRRTVFACVFWICIVLPYFAIVFFRRAFCAISGSGNSPSSVRCSAPASRWSAPPPAGISRAGSDGAKSLSRGCSAALWRCYW